MDCKIKYRIERQLAHLVWQKHRSTSQEELSFTVEYRSEFSLYWNCWNFHDFYNECFVLLCKEKYRTPLTASSVDVYTLWHNYKKR